MRKLTKQEELDLCIEAATACRSQYQQGICQALLALDYDRVQECIRMCQTMTAALKELQAMQEAAQ